MDSLINLQEKSIQTIRFLAADAIQKAQSGHPGFALGTATIAYTLWTRHLKFNPSNPKWFNRDRIIIPGHGGMLIYSMLYLTGYDISLDDIKSFRQWGSKAAGAPEVHFTPGVDATTGPLGQGFANGVGMAIAETHLGAIFNKKDHEIIDHKVYAIVTDGDLMEGISYEAASLAGHLKLKKLIYLYDDNKITIDGSTDLTFTENTALRFNAAGWQVINVLDGNNVEAIDLAIKKAQMDLRPSLIICKTMIGYGLPTKQGTEKAHGEPPGESELKKAKEIVGWPDKNFYIPDDVKHFFNQFKPRGVMLENRWLDVFNSYRKTFPDLGDELERRISNRLPDKWSDSIPSFSSYEKATPTRNVSGKVINSLSSRIPELIGGSADLASSNKTLIVNSRPFQVGHYDGRNIYYGIREQSMGGILNGLALHGGLIPYAGTFFVFLDYLKPALRVAAISNIPSIWVFSHDSIGVGEDGPTHQPIEQLNNLRSIPNLIEIRPADGDEVAEAWKVAIERRNGPTALIFTRQSVPSLHRKLISSATGLRRGAYVLADLGNEKPMLILMASGSEVHLILQAGEVLTKQGISSRVVSFPSWGLFRLQDKEYQDSVFPPTIAHRLVVEAGSSLGWEKYIGLQGDSVCINEFGKSAPEKVVFEKYGFTVQNIIDHALRLLD